ncbi:hypothetical protein JHD48_01405 [Sulfurimonas sp. SAG-AH-194-I05]|nr:hypothetical protein [Sulfurimonas sp. SAG-AH-194-I05]MDF1874386.1 hypothetical protein [Sulfurimonas sp. SAG-AH-194-I05]
MDNMLLMMLTLGGGLLFGLIVFIICEEKSLKDADFSDMRGLFTAERKISDCAGEFNTVRYLGIYFVLMLAFDLVLANVVFVPNNLGLMEMLGYTFAPALIGSWIILLVKWTYQPIIKLVSSFMYGSVYIGASILSFGITHFIAA